ncbi:Hypothetical predicted protein, partial [Pelobates cultripes]
PRPDPSSTSGRMAPGSRESISWDSRSRTGNGPPARSHTAPGLRAQKRAPELPPSPVLERKTKTDHRRGRLQPRLHPADVT